jgi:hypothetical protein
MAVEAIKNFLATLSSAACHKWADYSGTIIHNFYPKMWKKIPTDLFKVHIRITCLCIEQEMSCYQSLQHSIYSYFTLDLK